MVGARGFEPPTPRSRTECSTQAEPRPATGRSFYLTGTNRLRAAAHINSMSSRRVIDSGTVSPSSSSRSTVANGT